MISLKSKLNIILSVVLVFMLVTPMVSANSVIKPVDSNLSKLTPVSDAAFNEIQELESQLTKLNNEILSLTSQNEYVAKNFTTMSNQKELVSSNETQIIRINSELEAINAQLTELGVEEPSNEFLLELLKTSPEVFDDQLDKLQLNYQASSIYDEMEDIINTWKYMYNVSGYSYTHSGKTQYHLTFMYKGSDPYLSKNTTKVIHSAFSSGSSQAAFWVNEIISIYVDKIVGASLKKLDWVPWELLFSQKPTNAISSSGNSAVGTLTTLTTVKFVFIYNTSSQYWFYALSTNYVNVVADVSAYVIQNNKILRDATSYDFTDYGDYNMSYWLADAAYNRGYPDKNAVTKVRLSSKSFNNDQIVINIHNPSGVGQMY